jgi:hypothetical protein
VSTYSMNGVSFTAMRDARCNSEKVECPGAL